MKFFIGTTNRYKLREIAAILNASDCELEVTDSLDPEETEIDFLGNALLKAKAYANHAGGITISEDSGIVIPALNNLPGPWSARFSDCEIDQQKMKIIKHMESKKTREEIDQKNCELTLKLMKNIQIPDRVASLVIVLVVAKPDGEILFQKSASSNGSIAFEMHGENGFGYDPIFIGNDTFGKTYAELDKQRKNLRSHRNRVLKSFKIWLGHYLKEGK